MCSQYSCPKRQGFCSSAHAGCYQRLTRWAVSVLLYVRFFRYSWGYGSTYTSLEKRTRPQNFVVFFFFLHLLEASV